MEQNNEKQIRHWYLHIDLDAFFASVEQLDNPEFRGKPVIVGGRRDDKRGVVSTASYEARKYGVHSAMPTFKAVKLCPNGIFVRGRMRRYAELSYKIMNIFREFSPDVEQMSIDEAFVDLTGTEQLFGPPENTAMEVKKRVKELTGLTVSVGLATTKYLAKIASGFSKPDGFYFVHPGQELDFMLKLPLKKVWGIGPKGQEKLIQAGIKTTHDIYDKPLELLEFLLGPTMANFLYKVVRGEENESFNRKAKSHSISAENTYHDDITDIYTAETALLELAQGVMFRLLKEEKFSRTVTVKIKYDDFSSVSIQRTLDRNILTVDSFFDVIKELFEEKYENGRGIRLLGVGFDKVENTDKPYQQSLFEEEDDEKKRAVEKAILNINKKIPGVKIQKARLLKMIIFGTLLFSSFFTTNKLYAEEKSEKEEEKQKTQIVLPPALPLPTIPEEDPSSFFQWDINDENKVEFNVEGFWKGDISGDFTSSFGKDYPFVFTPSVPFFKQDVELSSLFKLNNQWYFQGNFADNFKNNTLTFGYKSDSYLREAKLSNRNITMPNIYSSSFFGYGLNGGNNQSPGLSFHFASPNDKWSGDFLFRYDMTLPKTETFYGMNKVVKQDISPSSFLYGYNFTFPYNAKNELSLIKDIYVEDVNGKIKDSKGIKYNKLSKSDYYYSPENNILYFSQSAKSGKQGNKIPSILVTFSNDSYVESIITKSGNYSDENSFMGKIQSLFNSYNLSEYAYNLEEKIENTKALKIQGNEGFSPFIIADTYEIGTNVNAELSVMLKTNGEKLNNYFAQQIDNKQTGPFEDFFNKKKSYAKVVNKDESFSQFPFASCNPEIYLNLPTFSDITISLTNYTPVSSLSISRKASSGTIQVYKNGVLYTDFIYDPNTAVITLSGDISSSDVIRVTYQEEASDYASGVFSLGMGYALNILPGLILDISLTGQYPLILKDSYSTINNLKTSFLSLTTGIDYKYKDFNINDKAAFSIQKTNTANNLLVSTQNNNTPSFYNHELNSSSFINEELKIKGYALKSENNTTDTNIKGIEDKDLKGFKLPLTFNFNKDSSKSSPLWAGINIKLNKGDLLKNSSKLKLKLLINDVIDFSSLKVYLQLGIDANKEKQTNEGIKTIDITSFINPTKKGWQEVEVSLSDKDRSFLVSENDLRVLVIDEKKSKTSGTIYIGPYSPIIKSIFTDSDLSLNVNTTSYASTKHFYSSVISWNKDNSPSTNNVIKAYSNFTPSSFSNYKEVHFKIGLIKDRTSSSHSSPLTITLDSNSINANIKGKEALTFSINNFEKYATETLTYHDIKINLLDKTISIDGNLLVKDKDYKDLVINSYVAPSRVIYELDTSAIEKGSIYIDNITYNESDIEYSIQNNITASYKKDDILKINNFSVFNNGFINLSSSQKFSKDNFSILSILESGITVTGLELKMDFALNKDKFTTIGHSAKTSSPLFSFLSLSEDYRWNKEDKNHTKENTASLSLTPIKVPLNLNTSFTSDNNSDNINQSHLSSASSSFNIKDTNVSINSSLSNSQNINLQKNGKTLFDNSNYFNSYASLSQFSFNKGEKDASNRKSEFNNSLSLNFDNFVKPTLSYNLKGNYENIKKISYEDTEELSLSLPFTFSNFLIDFTLDKKGGDTSLINEGGDYFSDLQYLFNIQNKRGWFYKSIPFYELFDKSIKNKVKGTYSVNYSLSFKKSLFNSLKDLYVPSNAFLSLVRDIVSKDTFSDTYQIKLNLATNALNCFGKNSSLSLFKFYNTDEISSGLSTIIKIPQDNLNNTSFQISSYFQYIFFFANNKTLNNYFDFSIDNLLSWNTKGSFIYTRNGETSLITSIISLFDKEFDISKYDIKRNDSFKYSIGQNNKRLKQQYEYNHSVDVAFLEHFTVTTGIGTTFSLIENGAMNLGLNYNLSGKISF